MSYIKGKSRKQLLFLPSSIEEYVGENNPVRIIDAFVDTLNMKKLGFAKAEPAPTGRPAYDPSDLLKLYIYGYMNKIRSSRRLMAECRRNIELFYLLNELTPDFRTIADFRKDNAGAIRKVFREFTFICSDMGLYKKELIAIDGTKVRAQNSDDKVYNKDILVKKLERIDAHIKEYMDILKKNDESGGNDDNDEDEEAESPEPEKAKDKLEGLEKRKKKYTGYLEELEQSGKTQILETDPECHRMHTRNGFHCCYNVQASTDAGSHLICEYDVTDKTNDLGQLANMSERSREALGAGRLEVVADKGYDSREDILNTVMLGIIPNVALKLEKTQRLYNIDYRPAVITDKIRDSLYPEDIRKCLSAGVLPSCFDNTVISVELQEPSGIACFTRIDEKNVICPMGKTLRFVKRRRERQTIFRSYEACRTCENRCKASSRAKEVCFVDGVEHVPVNMYGDISKAVNCLPEDYSPHHNSRALLLGRKVDAKVVIHVRCDDEKVHTRMCTVEHPFGSVKWYGDAGYVLCRGKRKVSAEIGLSFLAYNIKRAIKIVGTKELLEALGN